MILIRFWKGIGIVRRNLHLHVNQNAPQRLPWGRERLPWGRS